MSEFLVYFVYEPLTRYTVCKYFSHSVGCLFVLWVVSFAIEKIFSWMESHCFILPLFPLLEETGPKNIAKTDVKECTAYVFF